MLLVGGVKDTIAGDKLEYHWAGSEPDLCVGAELG